MKPNAGQDSSGMMAMKTWNGEPGRTDYELEEWVGPHCRQTGSIPQQIERALTK